MYWWFQSFGKHVIVTPYNLPPDLLHATKSLCSSPFLSHDQIIVKYHLMFFQLLIYELKQLWTYCFLAYNISCEEFFLMWALLMWTISDFWANDILSGWTMHERIQCPYFQDCKYAFQLKHIGKTRVLV